MAKTLEISLRSVFKVVLVVLLFWFLFLILDVLLLFFVTLIIVAALSPVVKYLEKSGFPRGVAVVLLFVILLSLVGGLFYLVVPPVITELGGLAGNLPELVESLPFDVDVNSARELLQQYSSKLSEFSPQLINTTRGVLGGLISMVAVMVMSIYLLSSKRGMRGFLKVVVPEKHRPYTLDLWRRIEIKMGRWLLGQIVASLLVGVLTFIGLSILNVPFALLLSISVGILEFIPYGPFFAFIPAVVIGFLQSSTIGIAVIVLYIIVQQIESNVVTPQIMSKAVGLNPVLVILAFLVGAHVAGVLGAVIAIPAAAVLSVFIGDYIEDK